MAMSKLDEHLEDPYYVWWVEAGTALGFLKTFLESLASCVSVSLHKTVLNNILVCRQKQNNPANMKMCGKSAISFKRSLNQWTINCCANCQCYVDQVVKCCDPSFKLKQSHWSNSDIQLWPRDSWELAKVYMNPGQKSSQKCPQDTDICGLINFLDNCTVSGSWWRPGCAVRKTKISKVRECRNEIMHSATLRISQQQFQDHITAMTDFLQDFLIHPNLRKKAQEAVDKIKEIQKSDFIITTDAEFRILKDRTKTLRQQNKDVRVGVAELQKQYRQLTEKKSKNKKKLIEELAGKIRDKENILEALDSTFCSLKNLVNTDKELHEKMESHISKTSASLNKTRADLSEVRRSHRTLKHQDECVIEQTVEEYQALQERIEMLRQQAEHTSKENEEMRNELSIAISKKDASEKQSEQALLDINMCNNSLVKQVEWLKAELDNTNTELEHSNLERLSFESKFDSTQNELENTKSELDSAKLELQFTKTELNSINTDLVNTKTELVNTKAELISAQNELHKTKNNCHTLRSKLFDISFQHNELKHITADQEACIKDLRKACVDHFDMKSQHDRLEDYLEYIQIENKNTISELNAANAKNQELMWQLDQLQDESYEIKAEQTSAVKELQSFSRLNHDLTWQNEMLREELREMKANTDNLLKKVQLTEKENQDLLLYITNIQDCRKIMQNTEDTIQQLQWVCDNNNQLEFEKAETEKRILLKQLMNLKAEVEDTMKTFKEKIKTFKPHFHMDKQNAPERWKK